MKCLYYQDFTESRFVRTFYKRNTIRSIFTQFTAMIWPIADGKVLEGELPSKALEMVREWISLHKNELNAIWDTQDFKHLPPLE